MLPGGSPGPKAVIPAPWRFVIILAGLLAILAFGLLFKQTFKVYEEESSKGLDQWLMERGHEPDP